MLETSEILILEKRWKNYKLQSYYQRILIFLFLASSIPLAWFMYDFIFFEQEKVKISNDTNHTQKVKALSTKESNSTFLGDFEKNKMKNNISSNTMLEKYTKLNEGMQEEIKALRKDLERTRLYRQNNIQTQMQEEIIDQEFLENNLLLEEAEIEGIKEIEKIEEKPRINIESNELKGLENLQKKFYQTKNIIFALMLAEEYYHNKNYKKSLKWALISNEADPENERSWIIFAKSKAKSGKPNKAIDALKAYLETHPTSQEIKTLMGKIKQGDY